MRGEKFFYVVLMCRIISRLPFRQLIFTLLAANCAGPVAQGRAGGTPIGRPYCGHTSAFRFKITSIFLLNMALVKGFTM
jgi:hypothetical protein